MWIDPEIIDIIVYSSIGFIFLMLLIRHSNKNHKNIDNKSEEKYSSSIDSQFTHSSLIDDDEEFYDIDTSKTQDSKQDNSKLTSFESYPNDPYYESDEDFVNRIMIAYGEDEYIQHYDIDETENNISSLDDPKKANNGTDFGSNTKNG